MFKGNGQGKTPGDVARIPFAHPNQVLHIGGGDDHLEDEALRVH